VSRRTVLLAIVLPVTLLLVAAGVLGAVAIDRQAGRTLPRGTYIQGVGVGGLTSDAAVARLRDQVEPPLHRPVKLTVDTYEARTSPWDLGYRIDLPGVVRQAMATNRGGNLMSRVTAKVFSSGGAPFLEARPAWGPGALDQVLADAAKAVDAAPKDADIDISTGWVKVVPGKSGRAIDVEASKKAVMDGVALGDDVVRLRTSATKAGADPSLSKVILVRAGENKLYLYDNGQIVKTWNVATGASGYLTPTGVWHVVSKIVGPVWYNPGSAWAKGLPAKIGPGPGNPLGSHALELDAPAILIHATSDTGSLGYSASHGCVRMAEADELELFNLVPQGTRVAIVQATPPRARGVPPADQSAAVVF